MSPQGHQNYRINDDRAVFVTGPINQELVDKLTPRITQLRAQSPAPITVYIDSPGGSTRLGAILAGLLRCPCQSGISPKVITVVTGYAGSAAADLLASGDYAIAYPDAQIHYHGTRQFYEDGITLEAAQSLQDELRQANEFFAMRLAERSIERFTFLFLCEKGKFERYKESLQLTNAPEIEVFSRVLQSKISPRFWPISTQALADYKEATELAKSVFTRLNNPAARKWGEVEVDILRFILDYELERNKNPLWTLTDSGLSKVVSDFLILNDFAFGDQRSFLLNFVRARWRMFVTEPERAALEERFKGKPEDLETHMEGVISPLWHFVFAICKRLQQSENRLTATDAYWLGIIDEVLGSELPCVRVAVENAPKPEQQQLLTSEHNQANAPSGT